MTQLRVFSDQDGKLYVEISHRSIAYAVRLSVPMLHSSDPALELFNRALLVSVRFHEEEYKVAFASLSVEALWKSGVREVGALDESSSRDVLNNLVDILGYE